MRTHLDAIKRAGPIEITVEPSPHWLWRWDVFGAQDGQCQRIGRYCSQRAALKAARSYLAAYERWIDRVRSERVVLHGGELDDWAGQ